MFYRDNGQIIENKFDDSAVVENFELFGHKEIPWLTIIIILVVLGLIVGLYVFYRKKNNEQNFGFKFV